MPRHWPGDRRSGRPAGRRAVGSGRLWRSVHASRVTGLLGLNVPPIITFVEFTRRRAVCYDRSLPELMRWRAPWGRQCLPEACLGRRFPMKTGSRILTVLVALALLATGPLAPLAAA